MFQPHVALIALAVVLTGGSLRQQRLVTYNAAAGVEKARIRLAEPQKGAWYSVGSRRLHNPWKKIGWRLSNVVSQKPEICCNLEKRRQK